MVTAHRPARALPARVRRARRVPGLSIIKRITKWRPKPKHLMFLVPVLLIGVMKMRGGGPAPFELSQAIAADELTVEAPIEVPVGTEYEVTVGGLDPTTDDGETTEVTLLVDSGYRVRQYAATVEGESATFVIEAIDGPAVGVTTLTAIDGNRTGHATTTLVAEMASDPLELFLGPRTIEATGETATMAVVLAVDRFGNPVPDGTPVTYRVTRPDLAAEESEVEIDGLISWTRILSGTFAGRSKLAVDVDGAGGKELDFLEIAGTPESFGIFTVDPAVPADGRSLVRVRTTQILDNYGNAVPDGLDVFADMSGSTGVRRLKSETVKGVAEFTIEAPSRPGPATVVVKVSGVASEPLVLDFAAMVTEMAIDVVTDMDGMVISVGPIFSTLGAYVPDGTPVLVTSEFGESSHALFNGEVQITLPLSTEPIDLEVLGFERLIQVDG